MNTPYKNQGRDAFGLDCGGLCLVVARELDITDLEFLGYANSPDGATFERLLDEHLDRIEPKESARCADILAFDYGDGIQHTAFVTMTDPYLKIIHAKRPRNGFGSKDRGVIETRLFGTADYAAWARTYRIKGIES